MLNLYISHARADRKTVEKLLKWLKPLQDKYYLRVWWDKPMPKPKPLPLAWQILFFWRSAQKKKLPAYRPELPLKVKEAHIYLFLTSYESLATPHINNIEIPAAVDRRVEFGADMIRVFPVLVSPSHWKKSSRLGGFDPLGPPASLANTVPEEQAYLQIIETLEPIIEATRQNWIENTKRMGNPTDSFYQHETPELPAPEPTPLPGWAGWLILLFILYLVTSFFTTYCAPKMYHEYKPEVVPYEPPPRPYIRDVPYSPPDTTNLPPEDEPENKRF